MKKIEKIKEILKDFSRKDKQQNKNNTNNDITHKYTFLGSATVPILAPRSLCLITKSL